ncbi:glycosyltransferase [Cryobacterium sp. 1639]|nr:glycosyltransferase [Cryobacterium sp. 1639]
MVGAILADRARLYQTVRSAHLERARQLAPATILHRGTRYDFDAALADGLDLVAAGPVRAAWLLARSSVRQLEVNEPLMMLSLRRTALAIAALRARALIGGPRVRCVSYAIENANPLGRPVAGWAARMRRIEQRTLARFVWSSLDSVAFGTDAARTLYSSALPARSGPGRSIVIPALPAACDCQGEARDDVPRVLFLGALAERKGFPLVLAAWPYLKVRMPTARLTVVGTGALADSARAAAAADPTIEVIIAPSRADIHSQLRRSRVLVLPSQPAPGWREQVGLPICEGLAHGCSIVTSTETGLAGWLEAHGHGVLAPGEPAGVLADELVAALRLDRSAASVLDDLPHTDGRLAADDWLFDHS